MERNPYTSKLYPKAINDDDGRWLYYECSKCMTLLDAKHDDKNQLENLFLDHVRKAHPPHEDVNQAAARTIREATERV